MEEVGTHGAIAFVHEFLVRRILQPFEFPNIKVKTMLGNQCTIDFLPRHTPLFVSLKIFFGFFLSANSLLFALLRALIVCDLDQTFEFPILSLEFFKYNRDKRYSYSRVPNKRTYRME